MADKRELLRYLETARNLEAECFKAQQMKQHVDSQLRKLLTKSYPDFEPPYDNPDALKSSKQASFALRGAVIGAIAGIVFEFFNEWYKVAEEPFPSSIPMFFVFLVAVAFLAFIGALVGVILGLIIGSCLGEQEKSGAEEANERAYAKWFDRTKREKEADAAFIREMEEDKAIINDLKATLEDLREEHYKDGPIYSKYQTLPAVCQLYEYFDSDRFDELGNAYNQYELEVRLDKIIDTTSQALRALYQIIDNQRILYDVLVDIRSELNVTNQKMDRAAEQLDHIAYTQEVSSTCLQQTALATTMLSQIEYYKNRHDLPFAFDVYEGALLGINARLLMRARSVSKDRDNGS